MSRTRSLLAGASFALGVTWAAAGILRWTFGDAVTVPLFPPLDLERVQILPSIFIGVGFFALGGWLGRRLNRRPEVAGHSDTAQVLPNAEDGPRGLSEPSEWGGVDSVRRPVDHIVRRTPDA
jgi:hypothetical protein